MEVGGYGTWASPLDAGTVARAAGRRFGAFSLEATLSFVGQIFGFEPADDAEPLPLVTSAR